MIISLLLSTQIIYTAAEIYNGAALDQPEPNSYQHVWHSYMFSSGTGNREELYISSARLNSDFESIHGIFTWKSLQVQEEIVIIGLGDDVLSITTLNNKNNSFTYKKGLEGSAKALAVLQKWDAKTQEITNFIIVAMYITEENYTLKWYQILDKKLKYLWNWPYYGSITHLDIIEMNYEPKLLIVNHKGIHKNPSAEIYNFDLNHDLDIWLFEKINLNAIPSSVSVFENNDSIFLSASFPSLEMIHIFKYTKSSCLDTLEKKHFVFHQEIFSVGLKSLITFQVGFRWYLAVASRDSQIFFIGENLLFQPISTLKLGSFNNWLAVPIQTYREDVILLADSNSDVSVITWTGDERLEVLGSFTELACNGYEYCLERMKRPALNESTGFGYNDEHNLIIPTKNGSPLFFKLLIKLKPLPDKVTLKLLDILNLKNLLQKNYTNQNDQISQLLTKSEGKKSPTSYFEERWAPEADSLTKSLFEIKAEVKKLEETIDALNQDVNNFLTDLKSGILPNGEPNSNSFLSNNATSGITFYGDVLINELNVSTVNDYNVNELLEDSFRKNKPKKIFGRKTLKSLSADNVIFEKLGNNWACDLVFSDDLWKEQNKNVINGDIIYKNKLNVLSNMRTVPEDPKGSNSWGKFTRGTPKHIYDVLNMEELKITEETHVQKTINEQPFILPVHNGQLNVLNIVNQARIEVINLKQNLDVDFINGRNFTQVFSNVLFVPPHQKLFDKIKIEGSFSAPDLQANHINSINLSNGTSEFNGDDLDQQRLPNDPNFYVIESNSRSAKSKNLRRVIHVFQNIEIDGVLFAKKINNISWTDLNDTVKMDEKVVNLTGIKKFEKTLKTKKTNLSGTLNGRFADHVLNNFSSQIIRFSQTFDNVKFKNLSLEGTWDDIFIAELNKTVVKLSFGNGQAANLTFKEDCFVNILNVTDSINNVNVKDRFAYEKSFDHKIELKSINASTINLHGSLITNNKINGLNLTNFSMLRVSLKSSETVDQGFNHQNITVFGDLSLETLNFNDISSIINSGGDTKLIGKFLNGEIQSIKKLLVKGNITASHGINGVNVTDVIEKGVCITKPGFIKGNITFENIVYFDNINVTNSVDGFSLKKLEKDIAFKQSQVFLSAPKNFSSIKVTKNMKARSLNGHLMQEVVSLKGDQTMKGPVQINGNVIVKGNITTYAAINNITVPDLLKSFSTRFNSFIYSGDLNLRSEQVRVNNLNVGGNIQNVSLDAFIDDAVLKDGSFAVTGKKSFKGEVKFMEDVYIQGLIHGVNFSRFYPDIIFINKPTRLKGTTVIKEAVLKVLETTNHFNSTLINNFDTNDWLDDSIPLNRYEVVTGKKFFENAYSLNSLSVDFINGHLLSAMIPLKTKQYIPALALFPRIYTTSDLSVSGTVNGKNLMKEFEDTVLTYGNQEINGRTLFDNEFVVDGNLFVETLNGKEVSRLITLGTEQIIRTPLEFKGLVMAKKDVEDLKIINNITLSNWNQKAVLLNQEQVLDGLWTVKGKVKTKSIEGKGLLHATSLPDVSKNVRKSRLMALERKNATELEYSNQCRKVDELSKQFSELPYLFDQFEIAVEIETSSTIDSVIVFKINEANHLIITFVNDCWSTLYKWNKENSTYDYMRQMNIGFVSKWSVIYRNKVTYLITSSLRSSKTCEENLRQGNVWVFKDDSDKYTHLLTSNAFVDIIHENNTSDEFFTIDETGVLYQWTLEKNGNISFKFLLNIGPGNYRFIDFRVMGGLAISDGREIKQITLTDDKVIENNISFMNANIIPLPVEGKTLIAVVVKDKILIYENLLDEKIFSVIQTYRVGSVLWFNYGPEKQAFLIVASHHKLIDVYEYKSVAGLVKFMSIQMFSSRLQSETLPSKRKYQSNKYLIVIQKKRLIFARADMLGDFIVSDSFC